MASGDIIILKMDGTKQPKILDCYANGYVIPPLDTK